MKGSGSRRSQKRHKEKRWMYSVVTRGLAAPNNDL